MTRYKKKLKKQGALLGMKLDNALHGMPALRKMSENDIMETQRELHKDMQQKVDVKHGTDMIDSDDVLNIVDKMNEFMDPLRTNLKFELHEQLDEYYVQVVNPFTNEVIKEIPPKKMLDMYAAMAEYMGILVDEKI